MARSAKKAKCTVTITQRAAQELKSIQVANAKDEQHVLRIDTESEGFSLWLGPEQEGDTLVGSERHSVPGEPSSRRGRSGRSCCRRTGR